MNCVEFKANWKGFITDTVDDATKAALTEHAKVCGDCRAKWNEHEELCTTIVSVLEAEKLPSDVADQVANKTYQQQFGASLSITPANPTRASLSATPAVPLLLAAVVGGLVGYVLAGQRSQSSLAQQLAYTQMFGGGFGRGNPMEAMLYAEMIGNSPVGVGGASGGALPAITTTVQFVFLAFFLLWITRTKVWATVFPAKLPRNIYIARWLALLAAIIGLARCGGGVFFRLQLIVAMSVGSGPTASDMPWTLTALSILDQLWAIGFWLTLMLVLFTLVNEGVLQMVRQRQQPQ